MARGLECVKNNVFENMKKNIKKCRKKSQSRKIFPLSPQENLDRNSNFLVYDEFLLDALQDERIHNIAITGNFGIGKSSILRTFCKKEKKRFIYISVADYNREESSSIQNVECIILKQLIAICHKNEVPLSHFQLVSEEQSRLHKVLLSVLSALTFCAIFFLVFSKYISEFLHIFLPNVSFHSIHLGLYMFIIIIVSIFLGGGLYQILVHTRLKEISVSLNKSDANLGITAESTESCLEQYNLELIYIIESLLKKYDSIVIEDLDRFTPEICISIFTRLRELNYSVNERMKKGICRFIYVVNDNLISSLNHTKFFDYILPIIPELGLENIREKLYDILDYVGIRGLDSQIFLDLCEILPEFSDYRTINQIRNEYNVFEKIEINKLELSNQELDSKEKAKLFAFVVYKVILPEDYYLIRKKESVFFPFPNIEKIENMKNSSSCFSIIYNLWCAGYLQIDCMKYIGYSTKEEKEIYCRILQSNDIILKKYILKNDKAFICASIFEKNHEVRSQFVSKIEDSVMLYFISSKNISLDLVKDLIGYVEIGNYNYTNDEKEIQRLFEYVDCSFCTLILEYFVKRKYTDFAWLELLLDDVEKQDKFFRCIEYMDDIKREYLVKHIHSKLVKNVSQIKQYTKLMKNVEKFFLDVYI